MNTTAKIVKYEFSNVLRGKWVLAYMLFFLLAAELLLRFGGGSARALLSLTNVVLILIPLVGILFGTMYLYNAREYTELLLTQPVTRGALFGGLYVGLSAPLAAAFLIGIGLPFLVHGVDAASHYATLLTLAGAGTALTFVFVGLAFLVAVRFEDKVRGLAVAVLLWLLFAIVYDGLVLLLVNVFADYPLEQPMIGLMLFNPVDLARVLLLLSFDASALMGYSGAVFEKFFGSGLGSGLSAAALGAWLLVPLALGRRSFKKKDF